MESNTLANSQSAAMTCSPLYAEVKGLHDALINTRLAMRILVSKIIAGEHVSESILRSLEEQYCSTESPVDSLEVVVRSRKQFDDVAIEAMNLRRENERLWIHLRVAREERDELIKANADVLAPAAIEKSKP